MFGELSYFPNFNINNIAKKIQLDAFLIVFVLTYNWKDSF